ncbi:MAG: hypothetical protein WAT71_05880 [Ignavibacteria bacterium]
MNNKLNNILEEFDSFSLEEQETILEIEKKRVIERKREQLVRDVKEAEQEFQSGILKKESVEDIMKGIDETNSDN